MIYILAPFSLNVNTTGKNRILSFYKQLKDNDLDAVILSPGLLDNEKNLFVHSAISTEETEISPDFIYLEKESSTRDSILSNIKNSKLSKIWNLFNLLNIFFKGYDLNYPSSSLFNYFEKNPLKKEDIVIASAPPFSLFYSAASITEKYECKLVLDYRDPWTHGYLPIDNKFIMGKIKKLTGRVLENSILESASLINCDSHNVKLLFPEKFQHKIEVILNGANLNAIEQDEILDHYPTFRVIYLGTIYNDQLKDETFFSALHDFLNEKNIAKGEFEIVFVGSIKNKKLPTLISKYRLQNYTLITPRVDIKEAMKIAYTASAFLHLKYGDRVEVDTSKHLDYLALQKPILLPITDYGNVAKSISDNNAGYVCNDKVECIKAIEELWSKYKSGKSLRTPRTSDFLYNISREAEAEKLVKNIKALQQRNEPLSN